jgi:hypothetical protein
LPVRIESVIERPLLLAAAALFITVNASAYIPRFQVSDVYISPGQRIEVPVQAVVSGLDPGFNVWHWDFYSADENVAFVEGFLYNPDRQGTVSITGKEPGDTYVMAGRNGDWPFLRIHVDCATEPGVIAAKPVSMAIQGQTVVLQAISVVPAQTVFQWYSGRIPVISHPIANAGAGPELDFTAQTPGSNYVWVKATTPCRESVAEFLIDVAQLRRRSSAH